ncbi:hypothetical protein B0T17DRAFT_541879 [Bombardia bombarda]|uniref:Protamine P1 n=1 Tax=Bombardia bombarda TaxID=252184 RepID=A0AA39TZR3_9PEZI|nr:hypothetical protein B0T17DRAFT_541879 [Bombardia bombarda]
MKRRCENPDFECMQPELFGDEPVYCEAPIDDLDDVLYSGSDDEHYADPEERRLRYETQAQRFLQGQPTFLLSASLRGPFEKEHGWTNPWRSKTQERRASLRPRKRPRASLAQTGVAERGENSQAPVASTWNLPSPESNHGLSNYAPHEFLDDEALSRVVDWQNAVMGIEDSPCFRRSSLTIPSPTTPASPLADRAPRLQQPETSPASIVADALSGCNSLENSLLLPDSTRPNRRSRRRSRQSGQASSSHQHHDSIQINVPPSQTQARLASSSQHYGSMQASSSMPPHSQSRDRQSLALPTQRPFEAARRSARRARVSDSIRVPPPAAGLSAAGQASLRRAIDFDSIEDSFMSSPALPPTRQPSAVTSCRFVKRRHGGRALESDSIMVSSPPLLRRPSAASQGNPAVHTIPEPTIIVTSPPPPLRRQSAASQGSSKRAAAAAPGSEKENDYLPLDAVDLSPRAVKIWEKMQVSQARGGVDSTIAQMRTLGDNIPGNVPKPLIPSLDQAQELADLSFQTRSDRSFRFRSKALGGKKLPAAGVRKSDAAKEVVGKERVANEPTVKEPVLGGPVTEEPVAPEPEAIEPDTITWLSATKSPVAMAPEAMSEKHEEGMAAGTEDYRRADSAQAHLLSSEWETQIQDTDALEAPEPMAVDEQHPEHSYANTSSGMVVLDEALFAKGSILIEDWHETPAGHEESVMNASHQSVDRTEEQPIGSDDDGSAAEEENEAGQASIIDGPTLIASPCSSDSEFPSVPSVAVNSAEKPSQNLLREMEETTRLPKKLLWPRSQSQSRKQIGGGTKRLSSQSELCLDLIEVSVPKDIEPVEEEAVVCVEPEETDLDETASNIDGDSDVDAEEAVTVHVDETAAMINEPEQASHMGDALSNVDANSTAESEEVMAVDIDATASDFDGQSMATPRPLEQEDLDAGRENDQLNAISGKSQEPMEANTQKANSKIPNSSPLGPVGQSPWPAPIAAVIPTKEAMPTSTKTGESVNLEEPEPYHSESPTQSPEPQSPWVGNEAIAPPVISTEAQQTTSNAGCTKLSFIVSQVLDQVAASQSPWARGDSQIQPIPALPDLRPLNPLSSPANSSSHLLIEELAAPQLAVTLLEATATHTSQQLPPCGQGSGGENTDMSGSIPLQITVPPRPSTPENPASSLPTPEFTLSIKPFREFMTPSPRSPGRSGHINYDSSPDEHRQRRLSTLQNLFGASISKNPWASTQPQSQSSRRKSILSTGKKNKIRKRKSINKRVSWGPLPGDDDAQQNDISVLSSPPGAELPTRDSRAASPPPLTGILATKPLPVGEGQKFSKHFAAMASRRRRRPAAARAIGAANTPVVPRMSKRLLPSASQQVCGSPAVEAMAEAFLAADSALATGSAAVPTAAAAAEEDDESMYVDGHSEITGGEQQQQHQEEEYDMDEPSQQLAREMAPGPSALLQLQQEDGPIDDVSAVLENLDDFLDAWDVDVELEKARREVKGKKEQASQLVESDEVDDIGSTKNNSNAGCLSGLMDVGVWD